MTDATWGTRPASTRLSIMRPGLSRNATIAGAAFICIPLFILTASALCSWAIAHGASPAWRLPFRIFCHGIPDRCLLLFGVAMPICARCTAIYIGLFAGLVTYSVMPWMREKPLRRAMYAAVVPLAVDGITQLIHLRESTNALRFGTGLMAGVAFGMWVLSAIENPEKHGVRLP
jgi:uncharacterized membrane protein